MIRRWSLAAFAIPAVVASCVAPPEASQPRPLPPVQRPTPPPPPVAVQVVPASAVSPGNWTYSNDPRGSTARFGIAAQSTIFAIRCDRGQRAIVLSVARSGAATGSVVALRASSMMKSFTAVSGDDVAIVRIAAGDPILDAIAFSRGRFGVALDGVERSLPTWPELTRVVEDCRA